MPADRFIHPKAGHSQKVTRLTDLEFRVWIQYLLSADDFGVMRASAITLQAENDSLAAKPARVVQRALDAVIAVGLVATFEHQGRRYICQSDWQRWQKVGYARATNNPKPPSEVLVICDKATRDLFDEWPGGFRKHSGNISKTVPDDSGKTSETVGDSSANISRKPLAVSQEPLAVSQSHAADARSKRPIFSGRRLTVFEWQYTDCVNTLGEHVDAFGLDAWFWDLDERAVRDGVVIPKRDSGAWLQAQLVAEAQRRGLPLKMATVGQPMVGKQTQRLMAALDTLDG